VGSHDWNTPNAFNQVKRACSGLAGAGGRAVFKPVAWTVLASACVNAGALPSGSTELWRSVQPCNLCLTMHALNDNSCT
jgi:hypothetical protein